MAYRRSATSKFLGGLIIGLLIALLTAFNGLLIWAATGPRSLEKLTPFIENAFHAEDNRYSMKIGETWLIWDGWKHPLDLRLRDVKILTQEGQVFSSFPEISVGLDILSLLRGRILPRSVTIDQPIISLFQNPDLSISFGFRQKPYAPPEEPVTSDTVAESELANTVPFAAVVEPMISASDSGPLRKLRYVSIRNAQVSIGNKRKGVFFQATNARFIVRRDRAGTIHLSSSARLRYGDYQSTFSSQFEWSKDEPTIDGSVTFEGLELSRLSSFFTDHIVLDAIKLPLSGASTLSLDTSGVLRHAEFAVESGAGTIDSDKLTGALPVSWAHIEGVLTNNANDIEVKALRASLDGMLVTGDGAVSLKEKDAAFRANLTLRNAPAGKVPLLWPPELAPLTREWVTTNITAGTVPEATARFQVEFGDLAKPVLPKSAVDATIQLEGATIRYLPEHPEVTNLKGTIHVDGVALDATIASADYMKETKISNGRVVIGDLNADNPYIEVEFDAETSARDATRLLGLPRLRHAERLNMKADAIDGSAKGSAALGFFFFAPQDAKGKATEPDIDFSVNAEMKGVAQKGFLEKFDISNTDGTLTVDNQSLKFKGKGDVNGASVAAMEVSYLFTPDKGFDTFITIESATAPVESLPRFGYPAFSFLQGNLGVKATVKQGDSAEVSEATLDLTDAAINAETIGWNKPQKEAAKLVIAAEKQNGTVNLTALHLTGKGVDVKGSGALNKELNDIQRLALEKFVLGNTQLDHLHYETADGGYKLEASGKSADLSYWLADDGGENTFSFEHFPAVQFKADIDQMVMGKGRRISDFRGVLSCTTTLCTHADLSGKMEGGKSFAFRILKNPKGQRQLSLHAEEAGAFLKAFDIYDAMEGGSLTLTGNYGEGGLKGRLNIRDVVVKDAPVLAKILSLASLRGFFDTLQGKGIQFARLHVPFTLKNDVITLKDAKASGPAIGMTADGTITLPKVLFDIEGTVVPAYTLNTMAGKLPLFGQILTGGEGQGVFAARYKVRGPEKDPNVTVNPLSMLTPGFLRGLFDVFDAPDKKEEEEE